MRRNGFVVVNVMHLPSRSVQADLTLPDIRLMGVVGCPSFFTSGSPEKARLHYTKLRASRSVKPALGSGAPNISL